MKLNNNDDSHNSGLNLLIYNMLLDIESHPAWVCGLKHPQAVMSFPEQLSHPAWVCGLKLRSQYSKNPLLESHPAWVCGLKHNYCERKIDSDCVTPCVGVWIETN